MGYISGQARHYVQRVCLGDQMPRSRTACKPPRRQQPVGLPMGCVSDEPGICSGVYRKVDSDAAEACGLRNPPRLAGVDQCVAMGSASAPGLSLIVTMTPRGPGYDLARWGGFLISSQRLPERDDPGWCSMKAFAFLAVAVLMLALAQPVAARPHDPESFEYPRRACAAGESTEASQQTACRSDPPDGAPSRHAA
jgi:hypothetical protein